MPDIHTLTEVMNVLGIRLAKLEEELKTVQEFNRMLDASRRTDRGTLRGLYTLVHQAVPEIRDLALRVDRIGEWVDSIRVHVPVPGEKPKQRYDRGSWLKNDLEAFARQYMQEPRPSTVGYRPNAPLNVELEDDPPAPDALFSFKPSWFETGATAVIVDDPHGGGLSRSWARDAEKSLEPPKSARQKARRKARMKARRAQRI